MFVFLLVCFVVGVVCFGLCLLFGWLVWVWGFFGFFLLFFSVKVKNYKEEEKVKHRLEVSIKTMYLKIHI